jgi:hypothetical protein
LTLVGSRSRDDRWRASLSGDGTANRALQCISASPIPAALPVIYVSY